MTIRVDVDRLPPDVAEALARGETVEFEQDGRVTSVARAGGDAPEDGIWNALAALEPLDSDLESDIAEALCSVLKPQEYAWES
jgi:hypothetical protein